MGYWDYSENIYPKPNFIYNPLNGVDNGLYQCVAYAQLRTGLDVSGWGMARNIPTNATTPIVGTIVKLNEGYYGHLAVIEEIKGDILVLSEANLEDSPTGGKIVYGRTIQINDSRILGYIQ